MKAECWRIDAFELWYSRESLGSKEIKPVHPKGNQPWIFIEGTDAEAEGPVFWSPYAKSWLIRKYPDAGGRRRGQQKRRYLDGITKSMDMSLSKLRQIVKDREACCAAAHGVTKSQTQLSNWTKILNIIQLKYCITVFFLICAIV